MMTHLIAIFLICMGASFTGGQVVGLLMAQGYVYTRRKATLECLGLILIGLVVVVVGIYFLPR